MSDSTATAVVMRRAAVGDVDHLVDFWAREGENHSRPADSAELVRGLVERDPEAIIVAELDGRIVGTIIAGWDGWRAHLYRLAVASDLRGHGVARRLVGEAERRLANLGAVRFDAMVFENNARGAAAWAAMGYTVQDDWSRWVKLALGS